MPKITSRWRLLFAAGGIAGLLSLWAPEGSEVGLAGQRQDPRPTPSNAPPAGGKWQSPGEGPQTRRGAGGYVAYVAVAGAYRVFTVDVAGHRILRSNIATDAAQGVAATPDGRKVYVANTGQYDVLVVDPVSGVKRSVHVGPYPRDVAVSPDGRKAYAAVSGGDTGKGGADTVAVIDTRTDRVVRKIRVGTAPRQVVFAAKGARAYVTYDTGIAVVDARSDRVVRRIRDTAGPQGVAVDPAGRTLYVTNPRAGTVSVFDAQSGRERGRIRAGDQPWGVEVTAGGTKVYVTQMNDNAVAVVDAAARRVRRVIAVGRLPSSLAMTPDGTEVWVGNILSGSISVISTASETVVTTISGGTGTKPIDAAPLGIAFAKAPSRASPTPSALRRSPPPPGPDGSAVATARLRAAGGPGRPGGCRTGRRVAPKSSGCSGVREAASGSALGQDGLDLQPDLDIVTEKHPVTLQGDVELDAEIGAQDPGRGGEPGPQAVPGVDADAVELGQQANRAGDAPDRQLAVDAVPRVPGTTAGLGGCHPGRDEGHGGVVRHVHDL